MGRKLPTDSFDYYFNLGTGRSYEAVAKQYSVSKKSVSKRATKEGWQERLLEIERKARETSNQKAVKSLETMAERHQKLLRVVMGKSLEALKSMPMHSAMDGVRGIDLVIKHERILAGTDGESNPEVTADALMRMTCQSLPTWQLRMLTGSSSPEDFRVRRGLIDKFTESYLRQHPEVTPEDFRTRDFTDEFTRYLQDGMDEYRDRQEQAKRVIDAPK